MHLTEPVRLEHGFVRKAYMTPAVSEVLDLFNFQTSVGCGTRWMQNNSAGGQNQERTVRDVQNSLKEALDRLSKYEGLPESQQIRQRIVDLEVSEVGHKRRVVQERVRAPCGGEPPNHKIEGGYSYLFGYRNRGRRCAHVGLA